MENPGRTVLVKPGRVGKTAVLATTGAAWIRVVGAEAYTFLPTAGAPITFTPIGCRWTTALKPCTESAVYSTIRRVPSDSMKE